MSGERRCGMVAIVGRPNVGKSTLLNAILGQKISITSRKPQTTRYKILGIHTTAQGQIVFVDTPGWQRKLHRNLNKLMNREFHAALTAVDVIILMIDARGHHTDDDFVLARIHKTGLPIVGVLNKTDLVKEKRCLLPSIAALDDAADLADIIPVSAKRGTNLTQLTGTIQRMLPKQPYLFAPDQVTDRSERFMAAEAIREKLTRLLGDELPYSISVVIDVFEARADLTRIEATVWVEKATQKSIVIGEGGAMLKRVGTAARSDLEKMLATRVFLRTWVKVRENWVDDVNSLKSLGFN